MPQGNAQGKFLKAEREWGQEVCFRQGHLPLGDGEGLASQLLCQCHGGCQTDWFRVVFLVETNLRWRLGLLTWGLAQMTACGACDFFLEQKWQFWWQIGCEVKGKGTLKDDFEICISENWLNVVPNLRIRKFGEKRKEKERGSLLVEVPFRNLRWRVQELCVYRSPESRRGWGPGGAFGDQWHLENHCGWEIRKAHLTNEQSGLSDGSSAG